MKNHYIKCICCCLPYNLKINISITAAKKIPKIIMVPTSPPLPQTTSSNPTHKP